MPDNNTDKQTTEQAAKQEQKPSNIPSHILKQLDNEAQARKQTTSEKSIDTSVPPMMKNILDQASRATPEYMTEKQAKSYEDAEVDFMSSVDKDLQRAKAQSWKESLLLGTPTQFAANLVGDTFAGFGYLADAISDNKEEANESAFQGNNFLIEAGEEIKEAGQDLAPIYVENPGEFDLSDPAQWANGLISTATGLSMLIPATGVMRGVSLAGRGLGILSGIGKTGKAVKATSKMSQLIRNSPRILGASYLSREIESTMESAGVFNEQRQKFLQEGLDNNTANKLAGIAAADVYSSNKKMWALDALQFASMMTPFGTLGTGVLGTLGSVASEGVEEGVQYTFTEEGKHLSDKMSGVYLESDFNKDLTERINGYLQEGELWNNAFFGAVGGAVFEAAGPAASRLSETGADKVVKLATMGFSPSQIKEAVTLQKYWAEKEREVAKTGDKELQASVRRAKNVSMTMNAIKLGKIESYMGGMSELASATEEKVKEHNENLSGDEKPKVFDEDVFRNNQQMFKDTEKAKKIYDKTLNKYGATAARDIAFNQLSADIESEKAASTQILSEELEAELPLIKSLSSTGMPLWTAELNKASNEQAIADLEHIIEKNEGSTLLPTYKEKLASLKEDRTTLDKAVQDAKETTYDKASTKKKDLKIIKQELKNAAGIKALRSQAEISEATEEYHKDQMSQLMGNPKKAAKMDYDQLADEIGNAQTAPELNGIIEKLPKEVLEDPQVKEMIDNTRSFMFDVEQTRNDEEQEVNAKINVREAPADTSLPTAEEVDNIKQTKESGTVVKPNLDVITKENAEVAFEAHKSVAKSDNALDNNAVQPDPIPEPLAENNNPPADKPNKFLEQKESKEEEGVEIADEVDYSGITVETPPTDPVVEESPGDSTPVEIPNNEELHRDEQIEVPIKLAWKSIFNGGNKTKGNVALTELLENPDFPKSKIVGTKLEIRSKDPIDTIPEGQKVTLVVDFIKPDGTPLTVGGTPVQSYMHTSDYVNKSDLYSRAEKFIFQTKRAEIVTALREGKKVSTSIIDMSGGYANYHSNENGEANFALDTIIKNRDDIKLILGVPDKDKHGRILKNKGIYGDKKPAKGYTTNFTPGFSYMEVKRADGSMFPLRLNSRGFNTDEVNTIVNLVRSMMRNNLSRFDQVASDVEGVDGLQYMQAFNLLINHGDNTLGTNKVFFYSHKKTKFSDPKTLYFGNAVDGTQQAVTPENFEANVPKLVEFLNSYTAVLTDKDMLNGTMDQKNRGGGASGFTSGYTFLGKKYPAGSKYIDYLIDNGVVTTNAMLKKGSSNLFDSPQVELNSKITIEETPPTRKEIVQKTDKQIKDRQLKDKISSNPFGVTGGFKLDSRDIAREGNIPNNILDDMLYLKDAYGLRDETVAGLVQAHDKGDKVYDAYRNAMSTIAKIEGNPSTYAKALDAVLDISLTPEEKTNVLAQQSAKLGKKLSKEEALQHLAEDLKIYISSEGKVNQTIGTKDLFKSLYTSIQDVFSNERTTDAVFDNVLRGYYNPPIANETSKALERIDIQQGVTYGADGIGYVVDKLGDSRQKALYNRIKDKVEELDTDLSFTRTEEGIYGTYSSDNRIHVDPAQQSVSKLVDTLIHESIHAVSAVAYDASQLADAEGIISERQEQAARDLRSLFEEVTEKLPNDEMYGLTSPMEMLAELSNKQFVEHLEQKGLWQRIKDAIKRLIGISDSYVDELNRILDEFTSIDKAEQDKLTEAVHDFMSDTLYSRVPNMKSAQTSAIVNSLVASLFTQSDVFETEDISSITADKVSIDTLKSIMQGYKEYTGEEFGPLYDKAIDNVELFQEKMFEKLASYGLNLNKEVTASELNDTELNDSLKLKSAFEYNGKDNASGNVKLLLSTLPKIESIETGEMAHDPITGLPMIAPISTTWAKLAKGLANIVDKVDPNTGKFTSAIDQMTNKIKEMIQFSPELVLVYQKLKDPSYSKDKLAQFFTTFSQNKHNYVTTTVENDYINVNNREVFAGKKFVVKDSNYATPARQIKWEWQTNYQNKLDKLGNNAWLQDIQDGFFNKLDKVISEKMKIGEDNVEVEKEYLRDLLSDLGIIIPEATLEYAIDFHIGGEPRIGDSRAARFDGLLGELYILFGNGINDAIKGGDLNLIGNESDSVNPLADLASLFVDDYTDSSVIGADGATYYTYSMNNYMTKLVSEFKDNDDLIRKRLEVPYNKNSVYLKQMLNPAVRENVSIETFNNFREAKGDNGTKFGDLSPVDEMAVRINQTLNGHMCMLTAADKGVLYLLKGFNKLATGVQYKNGTYNIGRPTIDIFSAYFVDELARMRQAWGEVHGPNKLDEDQLIQYYHTGKDGGNAFKSILFPELSPEYLKKNDPSRYEKLNLYMRSKEDKPKFTAGVQAGIAEQVQESLQRRIDEDFQQALDLGIVYYDADGILQNKGIDHKLVDLSKDDSQEDAIRNALADYSLNALIANVETTKMFTGDPAYYKTPGDLQKRVPAIIAPGMDLFLESKEDLHFNAAVLNDLEVEIDEERYNQYHEALVEDLMKGSKSITTSDAVAKAHKMLEPYKEVNVADAQAYCTLDRYEFLLKKLGKWKEDKMRQPIDDLKQGKIPAEDASILLNPLKGVYFGQNDSQNKAVPTYLKYSLAPLIPGMIKGTKLEELNNQMMGDGTYENQIHEVIYNSGVKAGARGQVNTDKIQEGLNGFQLDNRYWKLQQDLSSKYFKKGKAIEGSQVLKNVIANINKTDDYFGSTGEQLMQDYVDVDIALSDLGRESFLREMGITENEEGQLELPANPARDRKGNLSKLYKTLISELKSKDAQDSVIEMLEKGVALDAIPQFRKKIQQTILSMLNKRTVGLNMPGGAFIQMSPAMLEYTDKNVESDIVWLTEDRTLKPARIEGGGTLISSAQVLEENIEGFNERVQDPNDSITDDLVAADLLHKHYEIKTLPIDSIDVSLKGQAGKEATYLKEEISSIEDQKTPILINSRGELVEGWHRYQSMKAAGIKDIKAYVPARKEGGVVKPMQVLLPQRAFDEYRALMPNLSDKELANMLKEEGLLEGVGYRIPNQDMASTDYIEIAGILPSYMGDTVIAAKEITAKTGSDYDIDKMYVMLPNFEANYKPNEGKRKDFIKENAAVFAELRFESEVKDMSDGDLLQALIETPKGMRSNLENQLVESFNEFRRGDLIGVSKVPEGNGSEKALQNKKLGMYKKVLTSPNTFARLVTPIDSSWLKDQAKNVRTWRKYRGLTDAQVMEIENIEEAPDNLAFFGAKHQFDTKRSFAGGKLGVGQGANQLVDHPLTQMAGVKLRSSYLKGSRVDEEKGLTHFTNKYDVNGGLITSNLSAYLNANVDIAKDPYIFDLNSNTYTFNTTAMLIRAGFDPEWVNYLMSQDIIVDMANQEINSKGRLSSPKFKEGNIITNEEYVRTSYEGESGKVFKSYGKSFPTKKDLIEEIKNPTPKGQNSLLDMFLAYKDIGEALGQQVTAFKFDTNGAGITITDGIIQENKVRNALADKTFSNVENRLNRTMTGAYKLNSQDLSMEIMPTLFLGASNSLKSSIAYISSLLSNRLITNKELATKIEDGFYAHTMQQFPGFKEENVPRLFTRTPAILLRQKKEDSSIHRNLLIEALTVQEEGKYSFIRLGSGKKGTEAKNLLSEAWEELLEHENPKVRDFAQDLVKHAVYSSGMKSKAGAFFDLIPDSYYENKTGNNIDEFVTKAMNDAVNQGYNSDFVHKFVMNNKMDKQIVKPLDNIDVYSVDELGDQSQAISVSDENKGLVIGKDEFDKKVMVEYVQRNGMLFKLSGYETNGEGRNGVYTRMPDMGVQGEFNSIIEYSNEASQFNEDNSYNISEDEFYLDTAFPVKMVYDQVKSSQNSENEADVDAKLKILRKNFPSEVEYDSSMSSIAKVSLENSIPVVTLNPDKLAKDSIIHEYGHIYIEGLGGTSNPLIREGISQLRGTDLWNEVSKNYPELDADNLEKEVLTTAVGLEGAKLFDSGIQNIPKWRTWLDSFFRAIKELFGHPESVAKKLAREMITGQIREMQNENTYGEYNQKSELEEDINLDVDNLTELVDNIKAAIKAKIRNKVRAGKSDTKSKYVEGLEDLLKKLDETGQVQTVAMFVENAMEETNKAAKALRAEIEEGKMTVARLNEISQYVNTYDVLGNVSEYMDYLDHFENEEFTKEIMDRVRVGISKAESSRRQISAMFNKEFIDVLARESAPYSNIAWTNRRDELQREYRTNNPGSGKEWQAKMDKFVKDTMSLELDEIKNKEISYLKKVFKKAKNDISFFKANLLDPAAISDPIIRIGTKIMEKADFKSIHEYLPMFKDSIKKYQDYTKNRRSKGYVNPEKLNEKFILSNEYIVGTNAAKAMIKHGEMTQEDVDYISMINKINSYADSLLPEGHRLEQRLPSIRKSDMERLNETGILSMMREKFDEGFKKQVDDIEEGDMENFVEVFINSQGEEQKLVPIHFRGKIDPKDQSHDLFGMALTNLYMAINFNNKTEAAPMMNLLHKAVNERQIEQRTADGLTKVIKDTLNKYFKEGKTSNAADAFSNLMDTRLYGISIRPGGDFMGINVNKAVRSMTGYASSIQLSLNPTSALSNVVQGMMSNFTEAAGGLYFGGKDITFAMGEYAKQLPGILKDRMDRVETKTSKLDLVMEEFDMMSENYSSIKKMLDENQLVRVADKKNLQVLSDMGEHYIQGTLMLAIMNNIDAFDKDGKRLGSLWDMYSVEGNKLVVDPKMASTSRNRHSSSFGLDEKFEISQMMRYLNADLNGNYSSANKAKIQTYALGVAAMSMRKWIGRGIMKRFRGYENFGKLMKDRDLNDLEVNYTEQLKDFHEGRYITAVNFVSEIIEEAKVNKTLAIGKVYDSLEPTEKANMKQNAMEIAMFTAFFALAAAMSNLGDEEEEHGFGSNYFYAYMAQRALNDLQFYVNPKEWIKTADTVSVSLKPLASLMDATGSTLYALLAALTPLEADKYKSGKNKDQYKFLVKAKKATPYISILDKWEKDFKQSYNFQKEGGF